MYDKNKWQIHKRSKLNGSVCFICCNKVLSLYARSWSSVHFIRHLAPFDNNIQLALCLVSQYLCNTAHDNNILIPDHLFIYSFVLSQCKQFRQ